MSTRIIPIAAIALLCACASVPFDASAPTAESLRSAAVQGILEPGFERERPRLEAGLWEGSPFQPGATSRPALSLVDGPQASVDLDGDGAEERIALLSASSGGSGERIYLAVFGARNGAAVQRGDALLVGDRVKTRTLSAADGEIVLEVVEAGPGEAMCCGTTLARYRYAFAQGALAQVEHSVEGRLSLQNVQGEWRLVEQDGHALPAGARAPTLTFAGDAVSGFGGCNRFSGNVKESGPGAFVDGPHMLISTRMACPPPESGVEDAFLRALGHARSYGFLAGQLLIDWVDGERRGSLVFSR